MAFDPGKKKEYEQEIHKLAKQKGFSIDEAREYLKESAEQILTMLRDGTNLKPPMVALLIAPDRNMRAAIHTGNKKITIREGHRDYRAGQLVMLCCHLEPWAVMADITDVRHCLLRDVTKDECVADGFTGHENMLDGMRRFYKTMTLASPVTIIRWTNARGYWVDNPEGYVTEQDSLERS